MPYHASITSSEHAPEHFHELMGLMKERGYRSEIMRTFEFGSTRNRKIMELIDIQSPYMHIRGTASPGKYEYRFPGSRNWNQASASDILFQMESCKRERTVILDRCKAEIIRDRIVQSGNLGEINELVSLGKVVEVPLVNDDSTVVAMDRFIK